VRNELKGSIVKIDPKSMRSIPVGYNDVERSWQRTRWLHGRTVIWVRRRKTAGRGEGSGNLKFDQIVDLQRK
jgi:hypothetical protein